MPYEGQSIGAIAFLLLIIFALYIIPYNPILGLVILFSAILIFTISLDPASAKVLFKLFTPILIVLLFLAFVGEYIGGLNREVSIIFVIILFIIVLGLSAIFGGADAGSGLVIAPMIVLPTLLALLADPTGSLAVLVASSLLFGWMFFVYLLIRKPTPRYEIGMSKKVGIALADIAPRGKIKVGAEIWNAVSYGVKIFKGEEVYIIDKKDLELIVVPSLRCPVCGEAFPVTDIPDTCPKCQTSLLELKIKAEEIIMKRAI